jgi:hypothetical protein
MGIDRELHAWTPPSPRTVMSVVAATCAVICSMSCHHPATVTPLVPVPVGLDSAGVVRWLDEHRSACRGRLVTFRDEGSVRNFDSVVMSRGFHYQSWVVAVQCQA